MPTGAPFLIAVGIIPGWPGIPQVANWAVWGGGCHVQLAAEGTPALVAATGVCELQPVVSMATQEDCEGGGECKAEPFLLPSKEGHYSPLSAGAKCAGASDDEDCGD